MSTYVLPPCQLCGKESVSSFGAKLSITQGRENTYASVTTTFDVCAECRHALQRAPWEPTPVIAVALLVGSLLVVDKVKGLYPETRDAQPR